MSEELLNFHQVMNKMQEMEEEVQDDHKAVTEVCHFVFTALHCYRVCSVLSHIVKHAHMHNLHVSAKHSIRRHGRVHT